MDKTMEFSKVIGAVNALPLRYSVKILVLLKPICLVNLATHRMSLNVDVDTIRVLDLKGPIEDYNETFWTSKRCHLASVLEIILKIKNLKLSTYFHDKKYANLLIDSLNSDRDSIRELLKKGIRLTENKDINTIVAEVFNFIILNFDCSTNELHKLLDDTTALFWKKKSNLTSSEDWILLYTFIDILLNIARVSTVDENITNILDFFMIQISSESPYGHYDNSNEILKLPISRLKIRVIESIAIIAQIPHTGNLSKKCHDFLNECRNLPILNKDVLRDCLRDTSLLSEDMLSFSRWKQPFADLIQTVFQYHSHVLRQFPPISTSNYIVTDATIQELKSKLPVEYQTLLAISNGKYWSYFCFLLLVEFELLSASEDTTPSANGSSSTTIPDNQDLSMLSDSNSNSEYYMVSSNVMSVQDYSVISDSNSNSEDYMVSSIVMSVQDHSVISDSNSNSEDYMVSSNVMSVQDYSVISDSNSNSEDYMVSSNVMSVNQNHSVISDSNSNSEDYMVSSNVMSVQDNSVISDSNSNSEYYMVSSNVMSVQDYSVISDSNSNSEDYMVSSIVMSVQDHSVISDSNSNSEDYMVSSNVMSVQDYSVISDSNSNSEDYMVSSNVMSVNQNHSVISDSNSNSEDYIVSSNTKPDNQNHSVISDSNSKSEDNNAIFSLNSVIKGCSLKSIIIMISMIIIFAIIYFIKANGMFLYDDRAVVPVVVDKVMDYCHQDVFSAADYLQVGRFDGDLDINYSIVLIQCIIAHSEKVVQDAMDKDLVMVIGVTGCGKSTASNWLLGCTMALNETTGKIAVKPRSQGGAFDEFFPIGDSSTVSKTIAPSMFKLAHNLFLCDAPGFLESRSPDISIANAVSTISVVTAAKSVGFLLLVSVHDLFGGRARAAKDSLVALQRMFGDNDKLTNHAESITFGITHASSTQFIEARNTLSELCEELNVTVPPSQIAHVDPLEREKGCISKLGLRKTLTDMKKVKKADSRHIFTHPALDEKDMTRLAEIFLQIRESCEVHWSRQQVASVVDSFRLLQNLTAIGSHPSVAREISALRDFIKRSVQDYVTVNILSVVRLPPENDTRKTIFANMNYLTSLNVLDVCFISNHTISTIINNAQEKLKEIEVEQLSARNIYLNKTMHNMLQALTIELTNMFENQTEYLSLIDVNVDVVNQLQVTLPILVEITTLKSNLTNEIVSRQDLFLHATLFQKDLDEMKQFLEVTVVDKINSTVRSAQIRHCSTIMIYHIKCLNTDVTATLNSRHTSLLKFKMVVSGDSAEETTEVMSLEAQMSALFNASLGLGLNETLGISIQSDFTKLQKMVHENLSSQEDVTKHYYQTVLTSMKDCWENIMSQALVLEHNLYSSNLALIESKFTEATQDQRIMPVKFDLDYLETYPLLSNHTAIVKRSLPLLPNIAQHAVNFTLGVLKSKMFEAVLMTGVASKSDIFLNDMNSQTNKDNLSDSLLALRRLNESLYSESLTALTKKHMEILEPEVRLAEAVAISQYKEKALNIIDRMGNFSKLFELVGASLSEEYNKYNSKTYRILRNREHAANETATRDINEGSQLVIKSLDLGLQRFIDIKAVLFDTPISLEDSDKAVPLLKDAGCLSINVTQLISKLRYLAKDTEDALVLYKNETVKLMGIVNNLNLEIAKLFREGHALLLSKQTINKWKAKIATLTERLYDSLERNVQFICKLKSNELPLVYLRQHPDYAEIVNEVLQISSSISPDNLTLLTHDFQIVLTDIHSRAVTIYSNYISKSISGWMIEKTIGIHVKDIVWMFDILSETGDDKVYAAMKTLFLSYVNSMQSSVEIDNLMMYKSYTKILSLRDLLLELQTKLSHHNFGFQLKPLLNAVSNFMNNLYNLAVIDITRSPTSEQFLDFSNLKLFMEVCDQMASLRPDDLEQLKEKARTVFNELSLSNLECQRDESQDTYLQHTAKQFVKYFAVANELSLRRGFVANMSVILGQIRGPATDTLSRFIYQLQSEDGLSEVCGDILSSFKVFSRVNIQNKNALAKGVTFPIALEKLVSTSDRNKSVLKICKKVFDGVYETLLTAIDRKSYDSSFQIKAMNKLASKLKVDSFELSRQPENTARLLAHVCAHFSYTDSQDTYYNVGNPDSLFQMHSTQVLAIFLTLGVDTKGPVKGQINEILTGEGKSMVLAMTAAVYALLGVNSKIVCYSTYLTMKDREIFAGFFESLNISHRVTYSTIHDLVNAVMSHSFPDLRSQVLSFLKNETVPKFIRKAASEVLLIDEVDIFFGEDFYGDYYPTGIALECNAATSFMRHLWMNRVELMALGADEAVKSIDSSIPYIIKDLIRAYPNLKHLLPTIIKRCQYFLKAYHSVPGKSSYGSFIHNDKVANIDSKSGGIVYYIGYGITFEYFFQHEQFHPNGSRHISAESLENNVCIPIGSGNILFSELPKLFKVVHGVTGTLAYYQEEQNAILANYGLNDRSFIPTTFNKTSLVVVPTTIYSGDRNDLYYMKIKEVLVDMVLKRRATLVFFDTHEQLEAFRLWLEKNPINTAAYQGPTEILSEYIPEDRRDFVINRAINTGKVTLSTKLFMRGTDFICRDSQLRLNGGVHVLLTFYPESAADMVQCKGRTCRQNDPGSFQMILFAQDLVDMGYLRTRQAGGVAVPDLSEIDELALPSVVEERFDAFLGKKRAETEKRVATQINEQLVKNKYRHDNAEKISQLMEDGNLEAIKLLEEFQLK